MGWWVGWEGWGGWTYLEEEEEEEAEEELPLLLPLPASSLSPPLGGVGEGERRGMALLAWVGVLVICLGWVWWVGG